MLQLLLPSTCANNWLQALLLPHLVKLEIDPQVGARGRVQLAPPKQPEEKLFARPRREALQRPAVCAGLRLDVQVPDARPKLDDVVHARFPRALQRDLWAVRCEHGIA